MDDRMTSSSSDAETAADRDLFKQRAEESLGDRRIRGYFFNNLVTDQEVLETFEGEHSAL
jgi:hypothetical protein